MKRNMDNQLRKICIKVSDKHGITLDELRGRKRNKLLNAARRECYQPFFQWLKH